MHPTQNDLPEATRAKIIELLGQPLAEAIDLMLQTKQAHWNVKGPHFIALHQLFDSIADEIEEHVDALAERITQLGGVAEGTLQAVARRTSLPAYPLDLSDGLAHVRAYAAALARFGALVRRGIDQAAELRDAGTADLFTEISRDLDKQLWFLEAHLQASR